MQSKRNILLLMPSLAGGGAERTLVNLLQKIDYGRYNIDLIVVSKTGPYVEHIPENVNVTYLIKNNFLARVGAFLHRKFNFKKFFEVKMNSLEKEYDVGVSFLDTNFTNLLFYTDNIKKRVAFIHSSYKTHDNYERFYRHKRYQNKLKENRYSKLDSICFVSNDSMEEFKEVFGEYPNMHVIYNMIDGDLVKEKAQKTIEFKQENRFSLCAVGSLIPVKGFDRLIRAAGYVKEKGYDFELHIVGKGPEEQNLKRLASDLNVDSNVLFHGFLKNPYPIMKQSDLFVMSSISEALPTVLCEAMILGKPSLVTNCSGCRGLVNSGEYGMMAEQEDMDLADKMMTLMDNEALLTHYGNKSLERSKLFDDDRVLQKYYNIFEGYMSGEK